MFTRDTCALCLSSTVVVAVVVDSRLLRNIEQASERLSACVCVPQQSGASAEWRWFSSLPKKSELRH